MMPRLRDDVRVLRTATVAATAVRLSVVVPNRDTGALVVEAVESLLAQSMRDLEVIVVDDGSQDDGIARVLALSDPRLTCAVQPPHGLPATRNTGLALARGPYVGFCDSDDVWFPTKAERHLTVMDAAPEVGLTYSWSEYLTADGTRTGRLLLSRRREPTARQLARRNRVGNGSTPIVRRDAFALAGPFDERFVCNFEDLEMWVRIAACTPFRVRCLPEPLTGYRVRTASLSVSFDGFLDGAALAAACFRSYVPRFTARDAARVCAEAFRIAARKSFALGDVARSRRYLRRALTLAPALVVSDPRAAALLLMHVAALPLTTRGRRRVYRVGERLLEAASTLALRTVRT